MATPAGPQSRRAQSNGLSLHYLEQGAGPPLLLLHGFPDHAASWWPLAAHLAASHRVIAPDLRGYGATDRPPAIADYRIELLVEDVRGLLDALGLERVALCGHDWGGALAFAFAESHPDRVERLVVLNAPPLAVLQAMVRDHPGQRAASQYVRLLQSPEADAIFTEANVDALLERFLGEPRRRGLIDDAGWAAYRAAWTRPGVWQAMLAWYRAAPLDVPEPGAVAPGVGGAVRVAVAAPVLVIWGERDGAFVPEMAPAIARACADCEVAMLPAAGHVPHRDAPEHCAALITRFLSGHMAGPDTKETAP